MKIKKIVWIVLIIFIFLNMSACSKRIERVTFKDGYPDLKGRHIVVYVASRDEIGSAILELFKEKTGCTYEYLKMSTQESLARIRSERKNPKSDIFIGGTCDVHVLMKKENLSEKYISKNYYSIPDRYKDKDGYWIGFEASPLSIVINKNRWDKEFSCKGLEMPKTYDDLLNPIYKGEIVISDPNTSGTAYTMLASLTQSMGVDKAKEFFRKVKANVGEFTTNGYTPGQKVATGEYLIGINFLSDQLLIEDSGFNVVTNVPKNSGWSIDAISKIKNGPNGDIGKYFIDFCTDKEVEETLNNISFAMSTRQDTKGIRGIKLDELDIYKDYNFSKASNDREWLINMWNDLN
ncbi:iron deficiency-induced protein A precursor [Clostridium saccharobutylicum]|uniref:ABC transporter substrate-binding protein n=1 Tax=Clostridium saccharobutylicum TaxID=169679 RepID=UPI000983F5A5|nr:ABC transporter substrate-binding protein [Clostridium saccharobutylicum]AQS08325.1 iron deficiency-induced protein A precursor [Clostridium saccharobutylicum]MBC2435788.1 ABC transporter substrate-binding protein [Clostridium saccharobutylicum]NSB88311.1 iron(III) transport system substrate-binding protein [Clostridium saccharobutylicum]NYC29348.1 iron(III) transport system substrate-binding protein [Clostridium saccharobutylicum]OOM10877.1 iron deficiency-induced protein A precursor [Clos